MWVWHRKLNFSSNLPINQLSCLQGLKDLEYIVQEKSFIETVLEFEFSSNGPDSKFTPLTAKYYIFWNIISHKTARGVFYLDSGHSFDNVLFYGNDFVLFQYELMVFIWIFVMTNSYVAGILGVAGVQQVRIDEF